MCYFIENALTSRQKTLFGRFYFYRRYCVIFTNLDIIFYKSSRYCDCEVWPQVQVLAAPTSSLLCSVLRSLMSSSAGNSFPQCHTVGTIHVDRILSIDSVTELISNNFYQYIYRNLQHKIYRLEEVVFINLNYYNLGLLHLPYSSSNWGLVALYKYSG